MKPIRTKTEAREYAEEILSNLPYFKELLRAPKSSYNVKAEECFSMSLDRDNDGNIRMALKYPEMRTETIYYNEKSVPKILTEFIFMKRKIFNMYAD